MRYFNLENRKLRLEAEAIHKMSMRVIGACAAVVFVLFYITHI